ncbi:MAG TPA: response regulator transcription factor [Polyangiaceae bacterium]|nr:response regulator transcription factor [Polyangiaceae bacterium]
MAAALLLVEDDPLVSAGLSSVLARGDEFRVVASCASVSEARAFVNANSDVALDLALVDLGLPDGSGLEILALLAEQRPDATLLAFTQFDDPDHVFGALRAGAVGYLLKSTPAERLPALLREARAGGSPLSPAIARRIVGAFAPSSESVLTEREQEVLALLVEGHTYGAIATQLDVLLSTVQTHVKNLYRKLRVATRAEAKSEAVRRGLVRSAS